MPILFYIIFNLAFEDIYIWQLQSIIVTHKNIHSMASSALNPEMCVLESRVTFLMSGKPHPKCLSASETLASFFQFLGV